MKTTDLKVTLLIWMLSPLVALGTPDREVKVEESVLGSNPEGYVTLRTEVDNLGSYYKSRTKRSLVEYSKSQADAKYDGALGAEIKSEILLDVTTSFDASKSGPDYTASKSVTVNTKNEKIILADLLSKFPDQSRRWNEKEMARLTCESTAGIYIGHINIAWGGWIKERFCGNPNEKLEWKLNEVSEDANGIYFSVSSDEHGQRIVSIPPNKTTQVRDQINKQPVYLIAGKFKSRDEADDLGRKLIEKTKGKFVPEIWTYKSQEDKVIYALADSNSTDHLNGDHYESLEALSGVHFTAMSSGLFEVRMAVEPLK